MNENFIGGLPEKFTGNTLDSCGESGADWLNNLPRIIKEIEANWSLKVGSHFQNLSYNYVAPCFCADGGEAVLKIALPLDNPEIFSEARFLQLANGDGAVTRGLLKKPPPNSAFLTLDEWFDNFFSKATGTSFPLEYQIQTREFYEQLSSAAEGKFLIHGDLHHENILSATREPFLAIDPKGIVGDIGYEIAVFLNNHYRWLESDKNLKEKLNAAVRQFSEAFEIKPIDLRRWAYAQTVLSAWWTFDENGENWETDLALVEVWEANAD